MNKKEFYNKFLTSNVVDKIDIIISYCEGKRVLDVGCIGQDISFESDLWIHKKIKTVAKELVGVDINNKYFDELKQLGYNLFTPDSLNKGNIKFDIIIMGDVIEHVENPGNFINFYIEFLDSDGEILICTPNCFGIRYFFQVLFFKSSSTNKEHTLSFEPYTLFELISRNNFKIKKFYWLKEYLKPTNYKQMFIYFLSNIFIKFRPYFNSNFMFIIKK